MNRKLILFALLSAIVPCAGVRAACDADCEKTKHKLEFTASAKVAALQQHSTSVAMSVMDHTGLPPAQISVESPEVQGNVVTTTDIGKIKIKAEEIYVATVSIDTESDFAGCGNFLWVNLNAEVCGWIIETRHRMATGPGQWGAWSGWRKSPSCNAAINLQSFPDPDELRAQVQFRLIEKQDSTTAEAEGEGMSSCPDIPVDQQDDPPATPEGPPAGINPAGFGDRMPLGSTPDSEGFNLGSLSLTGPLDPDLADVSNLELRGLVDIWPSAVRDTVTGHLRQVTNLHRLADIQAEGGGGFTLRFYETGDFEIGPSGGLHTIDAGASPYLTIVYAPVAPVPSQHFGGIRVTRSGRDGVPRQKEFLVTSGDGTGWKETVDTEARDFTSAFTYDVASAKWQRIDSVELSKDGVLVSKTQRTFVYQIRTSGTPAVVVESHRFQIAEWVFDTAGSSLLTTWEPDPVHLGKAKWVIRPDGSWEAYRYFADAGSGPDSSWRGLLRETLRPWNGQPVSPEGASDTNSESSVVTYQFAEAGFVPGRRVTKRPLGGAAVVVGDSTTAHGSGFPYVSLLQDAGLSVDWLPLYADVTWDEAFEKASDNELISSGTRYTYVAARVAGSPWVGRSLGSIDSEGDGHATGYESGTFNPGAGTFVANDPADNSNWGTDVRSISIKIENWLLPLPGRATKEIGIEDWRGNPVRRELWVTDESGSWNLATTTTFEYPLLWPDGTPREVIEKRDGRVVSHTSALSATESVAWDEQGIETRTTRDLLGRTISVTRVGAGSQPDIVTTFSYNGLTTTSVTAAGALSRTEISVRDLAGRTVSETKPSGAVTTTSYPNGGRDTLTTLPGGLAHLTTRGLDGRTVETSGSAVVDDHFQYQVLPGGNLVTTRRLGDLVNSPRYTVTEEDWAGRPVRVTSPSPTGTGDVFTEFVHVFGTMRLAYTSSPAGTQVHQRDGNGVEYVGWDADQDQELDIEGTDRVTSAKTHFAVEGGFCWEVETRQTYDVNGSAASAITGVSKRCLHGSPNGLAAWNIQVSPTGGSVETQATINRSTKTLVQTKIATGYVANAVSENINGLLVSHQDHNATRPARWDYDAFGQPLREVSPRGAVTRKTYHPDGSLATATDHGGQVTQYAYYGPTHPAAGRLAVITNPLGNTTTYAYSALGQVTEEAGTAAYKVTYEYDAYGAKKKMWTWRNVGTSALTEWFYQDGTGLLSWKGGAFGEAVGYTYFGDGKTYQRTWARGVSATYAYTALRDLAGIDYSDATPDVTLSDHDRLGRPASVSQTDLGAEAFTYHPGIGAPAARYYTGNHSVMPNLGIRHDAPDAAGRPTGWQETSESNTYTVRAVTYGYDGAGNLATVMDNGGLHQYAYHPDSSLVASIGSVDAGTNSSFVHTRHYDTPGRLIGIRAVQVQGSGTITEISSHAYDYDSLGRRNKQTFQDGSRWEYDYNDRSEVTATTRLAANGSNVLPLAASYSYDGIGNRLSSTSPVLGDHEYTPNALNQYASITTDSMRTAVGRAPVAWNVQVAGVNAGRIGEFYHRELGASNGTAPVWQSVVTRRDTGTPSITNHFWYAAASFAPTYDADGNLTNDGRWTYVWNAENRLIQMEGTAQATAAGHPYTKLTFVYDWQGRRLARHVWQGGTAVAPVFKSTHRWLYDGWNPITEFTAVAESSTTLDRLNAYTWGLDLSGTLQGAGGVGGLLTINHQPLGINSAPSYDGNGNIVAWTRFGDTAPTSRREYDAFGNTLVSEGIAPCGFGFSTKMQDGDTGLYYYGYRYYDPVTGSWRSQDPIEETGGANLYGFVANNPLSQIDILGMFLRGYYSDKVVAKSFIKGPGPAGTLGFRASTLQMPWGHGSLADYRLKGFLNTIGKLAAFNEDPPDDAKDGKYRLYGEMRMIICCRDSRVKKIFFGKNMEGGKEVGPISGTINLDADLKQISASELELEYFMWGRPNQLAEVGMQQVAIRTSVHIWQRGKVLYTCQGDSLRSKVTFFGGGAYPSRRLWINNTLKKDFFQRTLADLWFAHPVAPSFVRE